MEYTEKELELFSKYMEYIKLVEGIEDIKWASKLKWTIIREDNLKKVVSFDKWKKMCQRDELLNELFSQIN